MSGETPADRERLHNATMGILLLERQQARAVREVLLGVLGSADRLRKIEDEIVQLRKILGG